MSGSAGTDRKRRWRFVKIGAVVLPLLASGLTWKVLGSTSPGPAAAIPGLTSAGDPVVFAAGDISCDPTDPAFNGGNGSSGHCREKYTAALMGDADAVLPLGDEQYEKGTLTGFNQSYDLAWGQYKAITRPSPGNHEYLTSGASGYFSYFTDIAGAPYYSWDIGTWHLVSLNSSVSIASGSAQYNWLKNDLTTHTNACVLAYWHEPRFKVGKPAVAKMKPAWDLLYQYKADLILGGHAHNYQRMAPLDPAGNVDNTNGIREIISGTGGEGHGQLFTGPWIQVGDGKTFGVTRLTLHDGSYDWKFVPEAGKTFTDSGTTNCH